MIHEVVWKFEDKEFSNLDKLKEYIFSNDFVKFLKNAFAFSDEYSLKNNPVTSTRTLFSIERIYKVSGNSGFMEDKVDVFAKYELTIREDRDAIWTIDRYDKPVVDNEYDVAPTDEQVAYIEYLKLLADVIDNIILKEITVEGIQNAKAKLRKHFAGK